MLIICTVCAHQYMYLHHFVPGAREAPVSELSVQFGLISTCISAILFFEFGKHLLENYLYSLGSSVHVSPPFCPLGLGSTC